jgi:hypothetical protein
VTKRDFRLNLEFNVNLITLVKVARNLEYVSGFQQTVAASSTKLAKLLTAMALMCILLITENNIAF